MRITKAWQQWLTEQEWEDKPEIDEEKQTSQTQFGFSDNDISASCFVEINEKNERFKVYAYPKIKIDAGQRAQVLRLIADLNLKEIVGRLELLPDNKLRYYSCIDIENAELSTALLHNVMADLRRQFDDYFPGFLPEALAASDEGEVSKASCVACNAALKGGEKFCPECGAPQQRQCASCKTALTPAAKFCPECGTPAVK